MFVLIVGLNGGKRNPDTIYRVWLDTCDVCKKLTAVVDASEYKYLKEGWDGTKVLC